MDLVDTLLLDIILLLCCSIFIYLFIKYFQRVALLAIQPVYQVALYNTIKHIHKNIYKHVQNIYI